MPIIAYTRVSTNEQADSGAGLEAQRVTITAEVARRGWDADAVVWLEDAGYSAKNLRRPALTEALSLLAGGGGVLVVARMDRASRSVVDLAGLIATGQREGWSVLPLDLPVDPLTPMGEAMIMTAATFSQLERKLIGERTKAALAAKRAAGVRLGRPRLVSAAAEAAVHSMQAQGLSLRAIAAALPEAGYPPPNGREAWSHGTVARIVKRQPETVVA